MNADPHNPCSFRSRTMPNAIDNLSGNLVLIRTGPGAHFLLSRSSLSFRRVTSPKLLPCNRTEADAVTVQACISKLAYTSDHVTIADSFYHYASSIQALVTTRTSPKLSVNQGQEYPFLETFDNNTVKRKRDLLHYNVANSALTHRWRSNRPP